MLQTIHGLCELRNNYGMASHGRDIFSTRLDLRQATLAAQAADTIVSIPLPHPSRRTQAYLLEHASTTRTTPISMKRLTATNELIRLGMNWRCSQAKCCSMSS